MQALSTSLTSSATSTSNSALPLYLGYMRVSKEDESTGSHTFETQEKRIHECLDRRCGIGRYRLELYKDDGISGGLSYKATVHQPKTRNTLANITERILAGECAGLVVYVQSRLFRNVSALAQFVSEVLQPTGTALISATEDIDIMTPDGVTMVYLRGIFDAKVREDIIKRCKDATATRAEAGYAVGALIYGWTQDQIWHRDEPETTTGRAPRGRRGIVPVESERHWLLFIKDHYLSGWNGPRIAGELNKLGVPSPSHREVWKNKSRIARERTGHNPEWSGTEVWRVLKSPLHSGQIRLKSGELIQGRHFQHRLWEPEMREQLEAMHVDRMARFKTISGRQKTKTLLNGLAFCARCGHRLYAGICKDRSSATIRCQNGKGAGKATCPDMTVRAQFLEELVIEELGQIAQQNEMRQYLQAEVARAAASQDVDLTEERDQIKRQLAQSEEQSQRWTDAYSRGVLKEDHFVTYTERLDKEKAELTERLDKVQADLERRVSRESWLRQVQEALLDFPLVWENLDNDQKRHLLSLLLEDKSLRVDRDETYIRVQLKVHLLPARERAVVHPTFHGTRRTTATGVMRLSQTQMVLVHYSAQGKTRRECADLMDCKVQTIYTLERTIRKNMGDVSWSEALAMCRDRVEAHVDQLPLHNAGRGRNGTVARVSTHGKTFLSPILMESFVLFAQGATAAEVASELHLPVGTVEGRRARIHKAFGTKSMLEAVRKAKEQGMIVD